MGEWVDGGMGRWGDNAGLKDCCVVCAMCVEMCLG